MSKSFQNLFRQHGWHFRDYKEIDLSYLEHEKKALCPHSNRYKEVIFGQKTGDTVCGECGESFMPNEKIVSPEYRTDMIFSGHALMVAMRVNKDLKLTRYYKSSDGTVYPWVLVNTSTKSIIPIIESVAAKAVADGYISLSEER